ncbi:MAG: EscT/YscT/HrcT family type III secretion system export apparatus protein [Simkania sp.]|nr:EscT/YscT/HrcT family type III secretion system export apparatus protein [Simkania sp.]
MDVLSPGGDYLKFFTSIPGLTPMALFSIAMLGLFRIAPIVSIAPFLGSKLPGPAKIGFAMTLTVLLLPQMIASSHLTLAFNLQFIGYSIKELLIGVIFAILSSIPFYIVQATGVIIDFQRGSSAMQATDPLLQAQVSPIGILYNYLLVVIFFQMSGPFLFIDMLMQSFAIIPVDGFFSSNFFSPELPFWQMMAGLLTKFTLLAVQFSAPSLVAMFMADLFLGIANRLAPNVQIAFLGMSIKSLLGLVLLWAGWFFVLQQMANQTALFFQDIVQVLPSLRT